jgi:hypothetical protein
MMFRSKGRRVRLQALRHGLGTARVEMAAARWMGRGWQIAGQADDLASGVGVDLRHRRQQRPGVGVLRGFQDLVDRAFLDDAPQVHDRDAIRQVGHDGEVVRDEQVGQPQCVLQFLQQIEDLRLHGDVQRAGRLVADHQPRIDCQGACNTDALALATGKLVRVTGQVLGRQTHLCEQLCYPGTALYAAAADALCDHALLHDVANHHARIHRGIRILEDELEICPQAAQPAAVEPGQFQSVEPHAAGGRADQLQDALAHRGLATTGLADQRQRAATRYLQRHPVHGIDLAGHAPEHALVDGEMHLEAIHLQQRLVILPDHCRCRPGRGRCL